MDKRIESFIEGQKNFTLCTSNDNIPGCASCFYAFVGNQNFLVFKSSRETLHIVNALKNNKVAGTIIPDISKIGTIKGIQFTGKFTVPSGELLDKAKKTYYSKYPFALTMAGELWAVELLSIKMTDNTLGFGKKLIWEKQIQKKAQDGI